MNEYGFYEINIEKVSLNNWWLPYAIIHSQWELTYHIQSNRLITKIDNVYSLIEKP